MDGARELHLAAPLACAERDLAVACRIPILNGRVIFTTNLGMILRLQAFDQRTCAITETLVVEITD